MKLTFKGKSAVISGASGGMGIECVKKLGDAGLKVLMLDLKSPPADFLKKYKKAVFKKVDVTNSSELKKIINEFYAENKSIDYLVNTTGVLWFDKDISATQIDFNVWDRVFEINLKSMAYLSKLIIPKMKKNKFGSMVHISSIDALSGDNKPQDAYGASKAAMIRLSKSLSIQFASYNIRSNVILPGPIETPMQKRWKKNLKAKKQLSKIIPLQRVG
ncbi:MAG: SDR family oxidoreductase, partial [Pelagibacteraceae bacterium]|nr:SDR family oxidoreductase [Pelagibacteraceae bacterium]